MAGEREYAIKHALTREVAYASLPKARRAGLHAAFADWLERLGNRDELAAFLAHHYAEAVRPEDVDLAWGDDDDERQRLEDKALFWLERAGELALGRFELDDALALLHRALALEPAGEAQARLWRTVGRVNALKFDGDAFFQAMQRSLDVSSNPDVTAETYGELAFQSALRGGMWRRLPEPELIESWVDRALESSGSDNVTRTKALIARSLWFSNPRPEVAEEATALAERVGEPELLGYAWAGECMAAFRAGDFETAFGWAQKRFGMLDEISDPDHVADIYEFAVTAHAAIGRFDEARQLALAHEAVVEPLSVHHRLHGSAVLLELDETQAEWARALEIARETEARVEANLATPCVRNARSLFILAAAAEATGDSEAAQAYELRAQEIAPEGYDAMLAAPRARLALLRGEIDDVDSLIGPVDLGESRIWFSLQSAAARLDLLAAARRRDEAEREATPFLDQKSRYLEPFALRTLGIVRDDEAMVEQAVHIFESMGLGWQVTETGRLIAEP